MKQSDVAQLVHDYRNAIWCYESFNQTGQFVEAEKYLSVMVNIMVDLEFAALVLNRNDQLKALRKIRVATSMTDLQYIEGVAVIATDELPTAVDRPPVIR
jgi:hypothetical protein